MQNYILIGSTRKSYGVKGEMKLHIKDDFLEDIFNLKVVFLKINGKQVPYFVESVRVGNTTIAKFEDINSPEETIAIASKDIYAREEDLIPEEERMFEPEKMEFEKYSGYTIVDVENGKIGIIKEVVEYPQQEMAVVEFENRTILVPLNHALIDSIDNTKKELILNLPEGLLDL
jgi:16S rRNA processing protein RimM